MTKTVYLTIFCLFFGSALFAQRRMDLNVRLISPLTHTYNPVRQTVNIKCVVKNISSFVLDGTDTIAFYAINGPDTIQQSSGSGMMNYYPYTGNVLKPGDSVVLSMTAVFGLSQVNDTVDLCVVALPVSGTATPMVDDNYLDNKTCATLYLMDEPNGIWNMNSSGTDIKVYPNPATGVANFTFMLKQASYVSATLTDISGRIVAQSEGKMFNAGSNRSLSLDINKLQPGIYLYQVKMGDKKNSGKLVVQ